MPAYAELCRATLCPGIGRAASLLSRALPARGMHAAVTALQVPQAINGLRTCVYLRGGAV